MACHGNGAEHCCWFAGKQCQYVEENTVDGRRWACGLLVELGDWDKVLTDPRYLTNVQPQFDAIRQLKGMNCRDWPWAYPDVMAKGKGLCCYGD